LPVNEINNTVIEYTSITIYKKPAERSLFLVSEFFLIDIHFDLFFSWDMTSDVIIKKKNL